MIEELEEFLQMQCSLSGFKIDQLTGDASSRMYFRISCGESRSYILCKDASEDNFQRFVSAQKFFSENSINVPKILFLNREKLLILQEDLGDKSLSIMNSDNDIASLKKSYKSAINIINRVARIQEDASSFIFQWRFDQKKLQEEIELAHKYFSNEYLKKELTGEMFSAFNLVVEKILTVPYVLVHRDYHTRNIHLSGDQEYLIDFQDARLGPLPYDLVSLLEDPYCPIDDESRNELMQYFFHFFQESYQYSDFIYWYQLTAVQRLYKILGSFTYLNYEKKKSNYLQYIDYSIERLVYYVEQLSEAHPELIVIKNLVKG